MIIYHYNYETTMKKIKFFILLTCVFGLTNLFSQTSSFIKFNELMVNNDSSYVDDYGYRNGWVEIFNAAFNNVNIGGMFITNDTAIPKKYYIPRNDGATNMAPRSYVVFFADNQSSRGTFHLNFTLDSSKYIAIYDSDGRTQLDIVEIPDNLKNLPNISYGKDLDQSITRAEDDNSKWIYENRFTPKQTNEWQDKITKSELISDLDSTGFGMAIVAMAVVFIALTFIFFLLKSFTVADNINTKKKLKIDAESKQENTPKTETPKIKGTEETGEVCAAIAMALHLYASQYHDEESEIITIDHTRRAYSPWGSKHLIMKTRKISK